ncbi:hypothetical protein KIN20_020273 [Parelaphostrongylus tenuis]|uniref:Uncharacterized protein n=1 Tax=Parelaphostrongylus tenuis TaxID=148309 RepID=A0AAD5N5Q7_PARTN|nr:hypothetical protein KIN20_020273 [Parelaphostrongylus tenuis]
MAKLFSAQKSQQNDTELLIHLKAFIIKKTHNKAHDYTALAMLPLFHPQIDKADLSALVTDSVISQILGRVQSNFIYEPLLCQKVFAPGADRRPPILYTHSTSLG